MRRRILTLAAAGLLATPAAWGQVKVDVVPAPPAPAADVQINVPAGPKADVRVDAPRADVTVETPSVEINADNARGAALNNGLGPGAQDKLEARRQRDRGPDVNVNVAPDNRAKVRIEDRAAVRADVEGRTVVRTRDGNNRWRYKWHNNHWWYWMPSNSWVIWYNGNWVPYSTQTYYSYYPRTYSRTYNDGYYSQPYRYSTGYRGYSGDGYYGNEGGAVGSEIGRGIGGRRGANIGGAIGGAVGGF